jgi:hypothetical protein
MQWLASRVPVIELVMKSAGVKHFLHLQHEAAGVSKRTVLSLFLAKECVNGFVEFDTWRMQTPRKPLVEFFVTLFITH